MCFGNGSVKSCQVTTLLAGGESTDNMFIWTSTPKIEGGKSILISSARTTRPTATVMNRRGTVSAGSLASSDDFLAPRERWASVSWRIWYSRLNRLLYRFCINHRFDGR